MNKYFVGALMSALLWIFLAFVAAVPSGWVHLPLVATVLLVTWGIVEGKGGS